jgi:hypothetical protein
MDSFLDLLLIARREDERDASDDDVEETQDRGKDERESDNRSKDLNDGTVFDEISDHKEETTR